ncbi:putative metal-dependent hydrolase [Spongiibacter sp. IMCC21906]|jgi:predicted metal-dependent hydrolase|uniref:metal-dependent hydrolase n=1 Tax=Spongiibacter sp. IMCC21906 TaxID=1620392 RepID=UPI00062DE56C|nr:metal-dependent hydrolase [Spongiibacter sp. IMCC21906]AKH69435.1 putative metal-dependent hydrolase [Spongiibacter sp. IMCC21906]
MSTAIRPVHRNLTFHLPAHRIHDWHVEGVHVSHFYNALSVFFPDGERFFIDSVRNYRDQIEDPELKLAVRGFIGQEAMHGREHEDYNEALEDRGIPVKRYSAIILGLLNTMRRFLPKKMQLATTIALEHLTAILAHQLLTEPKMLEESDPRFAAIWRWHALEETEHKAVAYDVYQATVGKGLGAYLHRCFALISVTTVFWAMVLPMHIDMVRREGELFSIKGWWKAMKFLWGPVGSLRKTIPDWLDYFKPGFHPWDHDNSQYLQELDGLAETVRSYSTAEAGA